MFLDLHHSHCKGRRKTITRIVPASMMNAKKMRTCSVCKKKAGHNSRTCPMVKQNYFVGHIIIYTFFASYKSKLLYICHQSYLYFVNKLNSQDPNKGKETTYEEGEYEDYDEDEEMSKDEEDEDINL